MERYAYLQKMPNSPLTPLTPLCENTSFDFNFDGDGSLDVYIEDVRRKHRMEQKRNEDISAPQHGDGHKKPRKDSPVVPRQRYSERFRKIRDIFEPQEPSEKNDIPFRRLHLKNPPKQMHHCCSKKQQEVVHTPKQLSPATTSINNKTRPIIKIIQAVDGKEQNSPKDYVTTPTNVRTPLKQKNHNIMLTLPKQKINNQQQHQHMNSNHKRNQPNDIFLQLQNHSSRNTQNPQRYRVASPVTSKPLCANVSKILHQRGLSMYCGLFQREEIDMFCFKMLSLRDLQGLGISNPKHCDILMAEVYYAQRYF
ncbi:giant nuclei [Haematobia irritans]|uniref:giant nuclei n=1 Tax=Haematobia irritans TaxID=7368 RepID=UPI003F50C670